MWKEGSNLWNVCNLGMLVGTAMNSTHYRQYSPWSSSLRFFCGFGYCDFSDMEFGEYSPCI